MSPVLIASEIYRRSRYGSKHPLSIPRVSLAVDLIRALGWLDESNYRDGPVATAAQLRRYHDPAYIDAVMRAERDGLREDEKRRWNVGVGGNPIYGEVFRRPATAAGSSILAAELLRDGGIVHSPAGGTHHGRPNRASGFCYFNDPVLGILRLLDQGIAPVAYVDLDAHHGDGVEAAFAHDPRVLTISVHEAGRWPNSGPPARDWDAGIVNLPVPAGFNDDEFLYILETAILPLVEAWHPQALVIQGGVDALADDPLSRQELSNGVFWQAVASLMRLAPRVMMLGGGGYNPWAVARAWAGTWAMLNGLAIPDRLPRGAQAILRAVTWRHSRGRNPPSRLFETLTDPPNHGPIREAVRDVVRTVLNGGK